MGDNSLVRTWLKKLSNSPKMGDWDDSLFALAKKRAKKCVRVDCVDWGGFRVLERLFGR